MDDKIMELKILEHSDFGEIRTQQDDKGNILFVGSDIANLLGYTNSRDALSRHCRCVVKHDIPHPQNKDKTLEVSFIPEPDVYRLITKSKLPSAREFERWVFEDVLPSLRKYGMYATDELLENKEKFNEMKEQLKAEKSALKLQKSKTSKLRKENKELKEGVNALAYTNLRKTCEIEVLEEIIEEQEELVGYAAIIVGSDLDMTPTQIAADYGISAIRLNNLLHEAGIQRKVNGQWVLYRKFMNCGYTNSFTGYVEQHDHYYVQTRWTQQGRLLIHTIMTEAGITPICELGGQYE